MAKIKVLKNPLTLRALKRRADKDGRISVNIVVSLDEVMTDIESFNDLADERVPQAIIGQLPDAPLQFKGYSLSMKPNVRDGQFTDGMELAPKGKDAVKNQDERNGCGCQEIRFGCLRVEGPMPAGSTHAKVRRLSRLYSFSEGEKLTVKPHVGSQEGASLQSARPSQTAPDPV